MRTLFVLLSLVTTIVGFAQERCASFDYIAAQKSTATREAENIVAAENFLQKKTSGAAGAKLAPEALIKIPVVVHVIYNNASQNISDAQVKSQIDALNRDFRRANADTVNTPERFRYLAADIKIEFYLALTDPGGRPTTGIIRKASSVANWLSNDKIKSSASGGDDAWDSKSYLNIWVGNLVSGGGFSSAPGSDAGKDGIVISTSAFGTLNRSGNYTMGRAAVHEVGHWLGLKHIWGDAQCGDDGIADTPPQSAYTTGCPNGFHSSCNNGETGDMYMNYMDYTADACMNLFTEGQKKKMRASFDEGGPRASLLQSKGLQPAMVGEAARAEMSFTATAVFPNPASAELNLNFGNSFVGKTLRIFNANGALVQSVQLMTAMQKLNVAGFGSGIYFIKGEGITQRFVKL